jgi:hypothetical protein
MRDVSQSTKQGVVAKVIVDQSHGYNGIETGVTLIVLEGLAKKKFDQREHGTKQLRSTVESNGNSRSKFK